ncbi:unnamed protein product [Urochloa humidicola]
MMASSPAASCSPTTHQHPLLPSSSCRCCCPPAGAVVRGPNSSHAHHLQWRQRRRRPPSALPDPQAAAALLAVAGTVGVAATLLLRSSSSSPEQQQQQEVAAEQQQPQGEECPDCGGTGLCGRCKGEGFVFKQLPEETATKARKAAKNMATRYTAGLPTKWTYCNKCSSTRSCTTCRGSGTIKATPATSTSSY